MHLPSHWHWSTLGAVARWGSGGTPKARDPRFYGGSIPWAVIGDLTDGPVAQTAGSITEDGLRNSSAKLAGQGGAQPNISQTVLKAWPIRIPALRVQAEAVLAAHSLRDSTRRLQSSAQALHARQGLLRGALLSAAFTGRLLGRAADDEVVEELANV